MRNEQGLAGNQVGPAINREINKDWREIIKDLQEINRDWREINKEWQEINKDWREIIKDLREINKDWREINKDWREIQKDRREIKKTRRRAIMESTMVTKLHIESGAGIMEFKRQGLFLVNWYNGAVPSFISY